MLDIFSLGQAIALIIVYIAIDVAIARLLPKFGWRSTSPIRPVFSYFITATLLKVAVITHFPLRDPYVTIAILFAAITTDCLYCALVKELGYENECQEKQIITAVTCPEPNTVPALALSPAPALLILDIHHSLYLFLLYTLSLMAFLIVEMIYKRYLRGRTAAR